MGLEEEAMAKKVCVTGAGGFVASWLVKLLLSKGYVVHGTVRQPGSQKYEHLLKLNGASQNLTLFQADLLNYDSLLSAISGCSAVFHVACPVPSSILPNPQLLVIEPAVNGTTNVLQACLQAKVQRLVFVSSIAAICMIPNLPKDKLIDESYWSDKDYCTTTKNSYCFSKTEAEELALDFGKRTGLDVVSICPSLVLGPMLQSVTVNASTLVLLNLLKGCDSLENKIRWIVDVRDVADAILLAYEKLEAEGRYICTSHTIKTRDLVEKLKSIYPSYKYPSKSLVKLEFDCKSTCIVKFIEPYEKEGKSFAATVKDLQVYPPNFEGYAILLLKKCIDSGRSFTEVDDYKRFSSEKLQRLGWKYRSLEETLIDSVESYRETGLLLSE